MLKQYNLNNNSTMELLWAPAQSSTPMFNTDEVTGVLCGNDGPGSTACLNLQDLQGLSEEIGPAGSPVVSSINGWSIRDFYQQGTAKLQSDFEYIKEVSGNFIEDYVNQKEEEEMTAEQIKVKD